MLSSKDRAYLKGLANGIDAIAYIGKNDLTPEVLESIDQALEAHELVKVKIQEGSLLDPKETANEVAGKLRAEYVQAIGRKFVLYRKARDPEKRKIFL